MTKKPYDQRTDLEKCQSQWTKLKGLHGREEWSAAVVRAATAAEIAANYAIRAEFSGQSKLPAKTVDSLLRWANGLQGKMQNLLVPLTADTAKEKAIRKLRPFYKHVNGTRNAIVHKGEFCGEKEATKTIAKARHFIESLVHLYSPSFKLKDKKEQPTSV